MKQKTVKYHYFVNYGFKTPAGSPGEGCSDITTNHPITDYDFVMQIKDTIETRDRELGNVVIRNWILLRKEEVK